MERYFIGNNTAYGFLSYYADELKRAKKAVLLKGGPGTGKSTLLRRVAKECAARGLDCEEWYCSGDPYSLDAVYIKESESIIMDATSPHACDTQIACIKDIIINLADAIDLKKMSRSADKIIKLINDKKRTYECAYMHLKCALCHYKNKLKMLGIDEAAAASVRRAINFTREFCVSDGEKEEGKQGRKLFSRAIAPDGEKEFFNHLRGREIISVEGNAAEQTAFFNALAAVNPCAVTLRNPLEPSDCEGVLFDKVAVLSRVGHYNREISESIKLGGKKRAGDVCLSRSSGGSSDVVGYGADEEEARETAEICMAEDCLNRARELHRAAEAYYIDAADFSDREEILAKCIDFLL